MVDPVVRTTSAFGRAGRPGLTKGYSVSTPNVASLTGDQEILERIRDLELQILNQQVIPPTENNAKNLTKLKLSEF